MTDQGQLIFALSIVILLVVFLTALLLVVRQRMRRRSRKLRMELSDEPSVQGDRAFNQIRIATAEADVLERSGVEVERARELLTEAQDALDRNRPEEAVRLGRSAHESLVALRSRGPTRLPSVLASSSGVLSEAPFPAMNGPAEPHGDPLTARVRSGGPATEGSGGSGRLPKNRAESHFQMTLLVEEIDRARAKAANDPNVPEAEKHRSDAQQAYAAGDFTEALRLSLRGRRRIGGHLETLPPPRAGLASGPSSADEDAGFIDPGRAEGSESGGGESCPRCGHPTRKSDRFCRSCGAPRTESRCPRCEQTLQPGDTFCGGCGSPVSA